MATITIYDDFEIFAKSSNLGAAIKIFKNKCVIGTKVKCIGTSLFVTFPCGLKRTYSVSYK